MKEIIITKNDSTVRRVVERIEGRKMVICRKITQLTEQFDIVVDFNRLMEEDYFLTNLSKCDGDTTLVLLDILVKNGTYVHPYGRVYRFCETAKKTVVITPFAFRYDERQIVRTMLFVNPSVLGTSLITFNEDENNTVDSYFDLVAPYMWTDEKPVNVDVIKYYPTIDERAQYQEYKRRLIFEENYSKGKIISSLIRWVDASESHIKALELVRRSCFVCIVPSNNTREKFRVYDELSNDGCNDITFLSSGGAYGADERELKKSMYAIIKHNHLIERLKEVQNEDI